MSTRADGSHVRTDGFAGQKGLFQFRLQVIDQGGNVSAEQIIWKSDPFEG